MRALFIHQNIPGQFRQLILSLCSDSSNTVWAICGDGAATRARAVHARLKVIPYRFPRDPSGQPFRHPWLSSIEQQVRRGEAVAQVLRRLRESGIGFDIIVAHPGWGEALFIKDIFPTTPLLAYFEFFYSASGADVGFDPEFRAAASQGEPLRIRNMVHLSALNACDAGISPTRWQHSRLPLEYRNKVAVIHEGVDTEVVKPDPEARFEWAGRTFSAGEPIVTYAARNLEPYRGFHVFMRSLPTLLESDPRVQVLIVGGDEVSYGTASTHPQGWKGALCDELSRAGTPLDHERVHFIGRLPYRDYLRVLQVSHVHVYLTYPFVLSWSMLEAMAIGCVVVGSNTEPVTEFVSDRSNGRLVSFFDQDELVATILEVLCDQEQTRSLRDAARQTIMDTIDFRKRSLPATLALVHSMAAG